MTIYTAHIHLEHHYYPRRETVEIINQIVIADSDEEARAKVEAAYKKDDPYCHNVRVAGIRLQPALE
jgi:hypothetical protein